MSRRHLIAAVVAFALLPVFEAAVLAELPGVLSTVPFFPVAVLLLVSRWPRFSAILVVLVAAAWRDSLLLPPFLTTLVASIVLLVAYFWLAVLLTNRSTMSAFATGTAAYVVYLAAVWGMGMIATRLDPAALTTMTSWGALVLGAILAAIASWHGATHPRHQQLSLPFPV